MYIKCNKIPHCQLTITNNLLKFPQWLCNNNTTITQLNCINKEFDNACGMRLPVRRSTLHTAYQSICAAISRTQRILRLTGDLNGFEWSLQENTLLQLHTKYMCDYIYTFIYVYIYI